MKLAASPSDFAGTSERGFFLGHAIARARSGFRSSEAPPAWSFQREFRHALFGSHVVHRCHRGQLGAADTAQAGVISNWIGRGTGDWNNPANWSAGVPGFAGVNNAVVTAGRGSVVVTFSGSGVLSLSNAAQNRVLSVGAVRTLVHGADHTIRGAGQLGFDNTLIINEGLIEATLPLGIHLDGWNGANNVNNGEMRARDSSTLTLFNTPIDNTNGVIRAEDGSVVLFRHGTITGGLLETTGSGVLRVGSTEAPELQNLHKTGLFEQTNDSDCRTFGTIVNDGVWALSSAGGNTDLQFNSATVTFEGSGAVEMSDAIQNRLMSVGAVRTFVNGASHTIRGAGQVGFDNTLIINEGVIEATLPLGIHFDGWAGGPSINNNILRARNGSTLTLFSTVIDDTNGVIRAEAGSSVALRHGTIIGGLLETTGDGAFVVSTTEAPALDDVLSTGLIRQGNDGDIVLQGTVTNDGMWTLESSGSNTDLQLNTATVTLAGQGEMVLSDAAQNRITSIGAVRTFVNGQFHTIRGAGQIGTDNTVVLNEGAIIADQPVEVFFDGWGGAPSRNEGTMHISGAGGMTLSHGAFTNTGTVKVDATSALRRHGPYTQTDGETRVHGSFNLLSSGSANVSGGLLSGDGIVNGPLNVSGGSASPSNADGSAIGSLELNGNYVQSVDGGFVVDLGLDGNDLMTVNGNVNLGGALQVRLDGPFTPVTGQEFVILTATGTINGFWQCVEFPAAAVGFFHVVYSAQEVKLVVDVVPPQEADLNNDGVVDAADLALLLGAWGDKPCDNAICCPADLDGDGKVTASDLAILLGSWS